MKLIDVQMITNEVAKLCEDANKILPNDVINSIHFAKENETSALGVSILSDLLVNINDAKELNIPVCQDTGMAVVFVELGQDVHITGGLLTDAINAGVAKGYKEGLLRCSVVSDPIARVNTNDNTPAIIHISVIEGDSLKITVAPKGFGSENMSKIEMLTPAATRDDIIAAVVRCVKAAGSNPCPPMVIGVGIGGDFEYSAILAKKALCRSFDVANANPYYKTLEDDMLRAVNHLGIGPQGFGGKTTALKVNIEYFATHIAGLPVAINIGCHVTRHKSIVL